MRWSRDTLLKKFCLYNLGAESDQFRDFPDPSLLLLCSRGKRPTSRTFWEWLWCITVGSHSSRRCRKWDEAEAARTTKGALLSQPPSAEAATGRRRAEVARVRRRSPSTKPCTAACRSPPPLPTTPPPPSSLCSFLEFLILVLVISECSKENLMNFCLIM